MVFLRRSSRLLHLTAWFPADLLPGVGRDVAERLVRPDVGLRLLLDRIRSRAARCSRLRKCDVRPVPIRRVGGTRHRHAVLPRRRGALDCGRSAPFFLGLVRDGGEPDDVARPRARRTSRALALADLRCRVHPCALPGWTSTTGGSGADHQARRWLDRTDLYRHRGRRPAHRPSCASAVARRARNQPPLGPPVLRPGDRASPCGGAGAQADRSVAVPGAARSLDLAPEPRAHPRPYRTDAWAGTKGPRPDRRDVPRPRRLQVHQRHAGPPGRRRAAGGRGVETRVGRPRG